MKKTLNGMILVREISEPETTQGGILIAETKTRHKLQKAEVLKVSDGIPDAKVKSQVQVGDIVLYKAGQGADIRDEGETRTLVSEAYLLAIL